MSQVLLLHGIVPWQTGAARGCSDHPPSQSDLFTSPTPVGVCGQAVPCAPAEQLMCPGGARQKAGVLHAPKSACSAAAPELWGSAQGRPWVCWCHRELVLSAELPCVILLGSAGQEQELG